MFNSFKSNFSDCFFQLTQNQIQERTKEINNLEAYNKSALARIEHYEKECAKADTERELLETQLDKLDKELYQVRYAATEDRQGNDKIMRENRQLHVQLHEHLSKEFPLDYWWMLADLLTTSFQSTSCPRKAKRSVGGSTGDNQTTGTTRSRGR